MTAYVALLRGIAPTNPLMRNAELRKVFEALSFTNVRTVISSGNVLFETPSRSPAKLESTIEAALHDHLGAPCSTIVAVRDRAVFSVIDTTRSTTPDLMTRIEKTFGKEVSTRTWRTVHRIAAAFDR